ncbi:MAG: hypothetical protein E7592_03765 [Ruminococcaceae bacterium]|nr:hypothetical protein [Oscillospiraceae bacterium]MBE6707314.1 hypothetical protein [Oscillospiraceae bacterium]
MNENKKGYWIYSIVAIIIGMSLFAFWGYLVYDLVLKLSEKDFSNNTVVQALFSLVTTVFLGGYFTKFLESRNAKKIEVFKVQKDISLNIIDYATALYYHPENERVKELLKAETTKVKLYFDNAVLKAIIAFINCIDNNESQEQKEALYENLSAQLKKSIK